MTIRDRFEATYGSLSRLELQKGAQGLEELGLDDLFGGSKELFLGFYTEDGLRTAFERYGFFADLDELGFPDTKLEIDIQSTDEHLLRVWDVHTPKYPLLELVARRGSIRPNEELCERLNGLHLNVLEIEWLQLQNPTVDFQPDRPPLPGQRFPGLKVGHQVLEMLRLACKRLGLDALATVPSYFHNALFYSEEFWFFDPHVQGIFLALCRDVLPQAFASPAAASWALLWQMVVDDSDEIFPWFHEVQVAPVSDRVLAYYEADTYNKEVQTTLSTHSFRVLAQALMQQLEARGIHPLDVEKVETWIDD